MCKESIPNPQCTFIIVPRDHDTLLSEAIRNPFGPTVMSFEYFMSWRTMFATLDAKWSRDRVRSYLFKAYNAHARASRLGRSMAIRIPKSLRRFSL